MKKSSKNLGARSGCEIKFNICGGNFDQCKFNLIGISDHEEKNSKNRKYQKKKHQRSSKSIGNIQNKDNKEESEYGCKCHISSTANKIRHNETSSTKSSANQRTSPPQSKDSCLPVLSSRDSSLKFDELEGLKHKSSDKSSCSKENIHEEAQETVSEYSSWNSWNQKTRKANNETAIRHDQVHTCKVERDEHLDLCKDTKTVSSKCTTLAEECCSRCSDSSTQSLEEPDVEQNEGPDEFPKSRGPSAVSNDFEECHSRYSSAISSVDQTCSKSSENDCINVEKTESTYEFDHAEGESDMQIKKVHSWLNLQHGEDGYYCKSIGHSEVSGESDTSRFDEDDNIDKDQSESRNCSVSFNIQGGSLRNCQFNLISLKAIEQQNIIEQMEKISGSPNSHSSTSDSESKSCHSNSDYKKSSRCSEIETSQCSFPITRAKEKEYKLPERQVFQSDDCIQKGKKNKNETIKARKQDLSRTYCYEQETQLRKYEEKGVSDAHIEKLQERSKQLDGESDSSSCLFSQTSDEAIHVPAVPADAQIEKVQDTLNQLEDESVSNSSRHSQTSEEAIYFPPGATDVENEKVHDRWSRQEGEPISGLRRHSQASVEAMHIPTASGWSRSPMKKKAVNMITDTDEYPGRISRSASQHQQVRKDYTAEAEGVSNRRGLKPSIKNKPLSRSKNSYEKEHNESESLLTFDSGIESMQLLSLNNDLICDSLPLIGQPEKILRQKSPYKSHCGKHILKRKLNRNKQQYQLNAAKVKQKYQLNVVKVNNSYGKGKHKKVFGLTKRTLKSFVAELRTEHMSVQVFGLGSYFNRLLSGEPMSDQERMRYEWLRLASFQNYQGSGNALALARNGFYHDPSLGPTSTRCYMCSARRSSWDYYDNVEHEHIRLTPECLFLEHRNQGSTNESIRLNNPSLPTEDATITTNSSNSITASPATPLLPDQPGSSSSISSNIACNPLSRSVREVTRFLAEPQLRALHTNVDEESLLSEPWLPIQGTHRHRARPSVVTSSEQRQTQAMAVFSSEDATGGADCGSPSVVSSLEQSQTQTIVGFSSEGATGGTDCVKPKRPANLNKEKTKVKPEKNGKGASQGHDSVKPKKEKTNKNSGLTSQGATGGHDILNSKKGHPQINSGVAFQGATGRHDMVKQKTYSQSHYNNSQMKAGCNTKGATGGPDTETRYQKSKTQKGKTNIKPALNSELATDGHNTEFGETSECRICTEKPKNTALIPCGHVVCCYACSSKLCVCPICRKKIEQLVKLYFS